MTFTSTNLPSLIAETSGLAIPKPGPTVAVCVAPAKTTISRPANWGAGQDLDIEPGTKHVAQDAVGDSYPNQEYDDFYVTGAKLDPATDDRAKFLVDFWNERGYQVETFEGKKVRLAVVLGEVDLSGLPQGEVAIFKNHEGTTELTPGGYILQSPDDENVRWFINRKVYDKKYQPVQKNS